MYISSTMKKQKCKCTCHGLLHRSKCNRNDMRNWKNGKCMVACNCTPIKQGQKHFCTGCVENHKNSKDYENMKELGKMTNEIFGSLFS